MSEYTIPSVRTFQVFPDLPESLLPEGQGSMGEKRVMPFDPWPSGLGY